MINVFLRKVSCFALVASLLSIPSLAAHKNYGVSLNNHTGINIYHSYNAMNKLWIEGSLGFWERSDIILPKLTTGQNADNAARQIGNTKKFSAAFEVKHYMKKGSYVKLGVLYPKIDIEKG